MKPNDQLARWLSSKEAAKYSNLGFSTLARFRLVGGGPAYSKIRTKILYSTADIDAWLQARRINNTSQYADA